MQLKKRIFLALLLLSLIGNFVFVIEHVHQSQKQQAARLRAEHIFSHRGASGEEEEHTVAAYDLAVEYGAGWLEIDLVTSMDGTLWISHDTSALRMTGVDQEFAAMKDEEIQNLKTVDGGGANICCIKEILERYEDCDIGFNIQIRDVEWPQQWEDLKTIFESEQRDGNDLCDRLIIQGQLPDTMKQVKQYNDHIQTLLIATTQEELDAALERDEYLDYIDIIAVPKNLNYEENIEAVHAAGRKFAAYTLNTSFDIQRSIEMGVDYYFTDYTAKALRLEERYRDRCFAKGERIWTQRNARFAVRI